MKSSFQLAMLSVFGVLGVIGVAVFALQSAGKASQDVGDVSLWGTFPAERVNVLLHELSATEKQIATVTYQQHRAEDFYSDLATGIASDRGPDLIIIDDASVLKYAPTLATIPFAQLSAATFQNTFIDAAQTFLGSEGAKAVPLAVDPLVMFWNKRLLAEHGYAVPPAYWAQIVDYAKEITVRDESGTITTSTIALGEMSNIAHADEILAAMILQAGGEIIVKKVAADKVNEGLDVMLAKSKNQGEEGLSPAQAAVRAFTEFSNPAKRWYSWNKALKNSLDLFADGDLALYIGRASEVNDVVARNPNLVFGIAPIPRIRPADGIRAVTSGALYALAIPKASKNASGAYAASLLLVSENASKQWEDLLGMPSPHRNLLLPDDKDATKTTIRTAAIQMDTYPNPDPAATTDIFTRMIDRITSGRERISESLQRADAELKILIRDTGLGNN
jgi:ABC-type glycerol-3-phosphate transport system substrate-binding protein